MKTIVLRCIFFSLIFSACVSTAHHQTSDKGSFNNRNLDVPSPGFRAVDTNFIVQPHLASGIKPVSLMELPRTEEGAFVLSPGFYEADFKTYCLQPGTPGPSGHDVYFQAGLEGPRKEIIQSVLPNSKNESQLEQKNVQLLLWSVVSHSDYNKLSPEVQFTARQLLSPKQIFELQGGVLGVVKTLAKALPASGTGNDFRKLFDLSVRSYEAYERFAVLNTPSVIRRTDITQEHWYKQEEGYYVRYLPSSYKQTRIQVYVPQTLADSTLDQPSQYIIFDPVSWVVVPANSNAQRLGIGGPVFNIIKSVIRNIGSTKTGPKVINPPRPPEQGKSF